MTVAPETAPPQAPARRAPAGRAPIVIVALVLAFLMALLFYGEARYRSCIASAEARYPAVPVSAFNQQSTGPLKVSFVEERADALDDCGRF